MSAIPSKMLDPAIILYVLTMLPKPLSILNIILVSFIFVLVNYFFFMFLNVSFKKNKNFFLVSTTSSEWFLEDCLAHSRCSVHIAEWTNE